MKPIRFALVASLSVASATHGQVQRQPEKVARPSTAMPAAADDISEQESARETYVDQTIDRLTELSSEIQRLRTQMQRAPRSDAAQALPSLRTAAGNRVVVLTKIQQLAAAKPETWFRLRPGVEEAFTDLEQAIERTKSTLAH